MSRTIGVLHYAFLTVAGLLATSASAAAIPRGCPLARAIYSSPVSHLRLSFVDVGRRNNLVSDLALRVVETRSGRRFWYYFDEGSAPKIALISTTDVTKPNWAPNPDGGERPYGSATFIGLERGGRILFTAPSTKSPAPDYVIIPELAELFKSIRLWNVDANAFVLTSCAAVDAAEH